MSSAQYQKFDEIQDLLNTDYYHIGTGASQSVIDETGMMDAALRAYVDALNDPYTVYFSAEEDSGFNQDLKGQSDFEGIGAVISKVTDGIRVEEVIKDSPAFKAGIQPLDVITQVDGSGVQSLDINAAVNKIKGPKGTVVKISLIRTEKDGSHKVLSFTVTRDKLTIPSVKSEVKKDAKGENIAYITISIIGEETEKLFQQNIADMTKQNVKGVILDLRGNGGGLLEVGAEIMSHFIPKGVVEVTTKYKSYPSEIYKSAGYGEFEKLPVVILVDALTASAGEIIAGGLREQRHAVLVGTTTFGKGSIQILHPLQDGAGFKFTVGAWYLPSGDNINKKGLVPDVAIDYNSGAYYNSGIDVQFDTAMQQMNRLVK